MPAQAAPLIHADPTFDRAESCARVAVRRRWNLRRHVGQRIEVIDAALLLQVLLAHPGFGLRGHTDLCLPFNRPQSVQTV